MSRPSVRCIDIYEELLKGEVKELLRGEVKELLRVR